MKIESRAQAREEIQEAITAGGPYTPEIISCVLRLIASRFGYSAANVLIEEFQLTKFYGIHRRQEKSPKGELV